MDSDAELAGPIGIATVASSSSRRAAGLKRWFTPWVRAPRSWRATRQTPSLLEWTQSNLRPSPPLAVALVWPASSVPGITLLTHWHHDPVDLGNLKRRSAPRLRPTWRHRIAYQPRRAQHQFAAGALLNLKFPPGILLSERQLSVGIHRFQQDRSFVLTVQRVSSNRTRSPNPAASTAWQRA